jgi:hypothetical protein
MDREHLKETARQILESSCREQGLEVQISDPVAIGKVAAILRVGSDSPGGRDPARIESVQPSDGRVDRDGVEHRGEHGALAA